VVVGETVIRFGEANQRMFIVQHGVLSSSTFKIIPSGEYFGDDMIFNMIAYPRAREYSVTALAHSDINYLSSQGLASVLSTGLYPLTTAIIRRSAFKLLFRRAFSAYAVAHIETKLIKETTNDKKMLFISYGRGAATSFAKWLSHELDRRGFTTWMDTELQGGSQWQKEIADAIMRCDAVVAGRHVAMLFLSYLLSFVVSTLKL
jgi:hypothetical protein